MSAMKKMLAKVAATVAATVEKKVAAKKNFPRPHHMHTQPVRATTVSRGVMRQKQRLA